MWHKLYVCCSRLLSSMMIDCVVISLCSFTSDCAETPSPSEEAKFRLNCDDLLLLWLESLLLRPNWPEL